MKRLQRIPPPLNLVDSAAKKGGKARAAKLTPERRREIARGAAVTRWQRHEG